MLNPNKSKFFLKFKEKNKKIYQKMKNFLSYQEFDSRIYFDQIDIILKNDLNQYNLIERQILIKSLLFDINPNLINRFEILSNNTHYNFIIKKDEKLDDNRLKLEKTTLDILNLIEKSEGCFEFF